MREQYLILIENTTQENRYIAPAPRRLARFLKTIKRAYGFECKSAKEVHGNEPVKDVTQVLAEME